MILNRTKLLLKPGEPYYFNPNKDYLMPLKYYLYKDDEKILKKVIGSVLFTKIPKNINTNRIWQLARKDRQHTKTDNNNPLIKAKELYDDLPKEVDPTLSISTFDITEKHNNFSNAIKRLKKYSEVTVFKLEKLPLYDIDMSKNEFSSNEEGINELSTILDEHYIKYNIEEVNLFDKKIILNNYYELIQINEIKNEIWIIFCK